MPDPRELAAIVRTWIEGGGLGQVDALAALDALERICNAASDLYDDAGVDDIDQRLDYLMLQVGRDEWNDLVAAIKP